MQNHIQPGHVLTVTSPEGGLSSGDGVLLGSLFGVATGDAAAGDEAEIITTGVVDLPKTSAQAWSVGDPIYWDASPGECTTVATANTLVGIAVAAAANPSATGRVRLNGIFGAAANAAVGALDTAVGALDTRVTALETP